MYRIAFVCDWDASDPSAMSGAAYSIRKALLDAGHEVLDVFPAERDALSRAAIFSGLLITIFFKLLGFYHSPKRETAYLTAAARFTEKKLRRLGPYDFVFSQSALPLGFANINRPIVFTTDQPFDAYVKGYVPNPSKRFLKIGRQLETLLSNKCSLIIFPSRWAADEFLRTHAKAKSKVRIIQWGANLSMLPTREQVYSGLTARKLEKCLNLVFIGRDWERKGGQVAVDVAKKFQDNGQDCRLTVIGTCADVPDEIRGEIIPSIDKNSSAGLALFSTILSKSHFLIVPSRAEAYGHVFCEAAAFGVPSVSTSVGGIPSIITDGENGICLPVSSDAATFYERMRDVFLDDQAYQRMAANAFSSFEERLSWTAFTKAALDDVGELLREPIAGNMGGQRASDIVA
jgi:glycosyltransferase involved in cell wall biosynthesis